MRLKPERFFMATEPREVKRLMIRGVVQKIGFRVWVERKALGLGLKGWVRNRLDGAAVGLLPHNVSWQHACCNRFNRLWPAVCQRHLW